MNIWRRRRDPSARHGDGAAGRRRTRENFMRKTVLVVAAAAVAIAISGSLSLMSKHAVAVSETQATKPATTVAADNDAQLQWQPAADPFMLVGDGSAGN